MAVKRRPRNNGAADGSSESGDAALSTNSKNQKKHQANSKSKFSAKRKGTRENHNEQLRYEEFNLRWCLLAVVIAIGVCMVHRNHIFTLFEGDKHFSHLSNLEREMAFRTEMGLYYSYFKTIIHAPTFTDGLLQITRDNVTEFPDTINTLKRFNLYPEVVLGAAYRLFMSYADSINWRTSICYKVNRGDGMSPVFSCEGIGEPTYFYVHAVMTLNGVMMGIYFLFGTYISGSILGGLVTVSAYFFNHGEATRVMWTPPLRESFAFPALVAETFYLSYIIKKSKPARKDSFMLALFIICFMLPWQFAQFALMTQVLSVFGCYVLGYINKQRMLTIVMGHAMGLFTSFILLFGNEMLLTSFYASCILMCFVILSMDAILQKLRFALVIIVTQVVLLLSGMVGLKMLLGRALQVQDDAHISDILKSKFTDFKTFDTLLYTCAKEFDFLEYETYVKLTLTGLIPTMLLVVTVVGFTLLRREYLNFRYSQQEDIITHSPNEQLGPEKELAVTLYNIIQMCAFVLMAVIIMRLKLFATPQVCLICGLIASRQIFGSIVKEIWIHRALVLCILALMAVKGSGNITHQRSIQGEYSNYPMEEFFEWVNKTTPMDAVFGGPMPTMANLKLSTLRPIINHPHYEDAGIRARTKKIYTMTSRKTLKELYDIVKELRADYIVYEKGWCLRSNAKKGCTMPEIWDVEDPENRGKMPLCVSINKDPAPYFKKEYEM